MKKILLFILLLSTFAAAQEQRYDNFAATLTSASGIGNLTQVIPNATITVFNQPAVGVSCAGGGCVAATTFTSRTGGTPCGGGLPLTRPTTNICVATADSAANFGFWAAAGAYQYCVASTNITTQCFNVILGATLDGNNTFSGNNTFTGNVTTGTVIVNSTSGNELLCSGTQPTITSGFNTGALGVSPNGTCSFTVVIGTGAAGSTGVLGMPTANGSGWNCYATNFNRADVIQTTASTPTSITLTNFGTTFAATNFTNSDILLVSCFGR